MLLCIHMKNIIFKPLYIFLTITALLVVVIVISVLTRGLKLPGRTISNFDECATAGYPIMESYPRQCRANNQLFVEKVTTPTPINSKGCAVAGCSGQLCVDADKANDIVTTCEYRAEYACYKEVACERQADGQCGWTPTPSLQACLNNAEKTPSPIQ